MRDIDRTWIEGEDGTWVRLADVLQFEIDSGTQRNGAGEVLVVRDARVVVCMRYRVGEIEGTREDRPFRLTLSTWPTPGEAVEAMRSLLVSLEVVAAETII